jgi:branched-chain amino acid transport system substrate-binding protein
MSIIALLASAGLVGGACSSSADDGQSTSTSAPPVTETVAAQPTESTVAPAPNPVPGWDIDAVLAADPDCAQPATGEPLIVGFAADLSPLGAFSDGPASASATLMAQLINCSGGLNGRPVQVIVADVSGNALASRTAVKGLVDQGVDVILGPPFADPGFRILQITEGNIGVLFVASTEPALADDSALSYSTAFNDTQQATAAAEFALTKGWTTAVTFTSPGPYFGYNPLVFAEVFTRKGGEVIKDYEYTPFPPGETLDFSAEVAEMAASGPPDVIFTAMLANQAVILRQQLAAAGLNVEVVMSDSFEITNGYNLEGADGIYHVTHTFASEGSRTAILDNLLTEASEGVPSGAPSMVALGGDAMSVVANAYLSTNSTDPKVLGEAIASLNGIQGVTGPLSYNGTGSATKTLYVHQVVNGEPSLAAKIGE